MLAMLSFRITEFADARIGSTRLPPILGYGSVLLVHTSEILLSILDRSIRRGARVGILLDDICDLERIIEVEELLVYFCASVFLMMTCCKLDLGPRVAARCIESLLEKFGNRTEPTFFIS